MFDTRTLDEVLGLRPDPAARACLESEIVAAVDQYRHEAATGTIALGALRVRGRPVSDYLTLDAIARLLTEPGPPADVASRPCYVCDGVDWWRGTTGIRVCRRCHPPDAERRGGAVTSQPRPLAVASQRLRRRPGRPRTRPLEGPGQGLGNPGASPAAAPNAAIAAPCRLPVADPEPGTGPVAPLRPRLVGLDVAALYLAVKPWHVRDLIRLGILPRVAVPLGPDRRGRRADGRLRKVLVDVADLDRLIEAWKVGA
jgi:hypothetical protein